MRNYMWTVVFIPVGVRQTLEGGKTKIKNVSQVIEDVCVTADREGVSGSGWRGHSGLGSFNIRAGILTVFNDTKESCAGLRR